MRPSIYRGKKQIVKKITNAMILMIRLVWNLRLRIDFMVEIANKAISAINIRKGKNTSKLGVQGPLLNSFD
jgi:hypothetical protein